MNGKYICVNIGTKSIAIFVEMKTSQEGQTFNLLYWIKGGVHHICKEEWNYPSHLAKLGHMVANDLLPSG